MIEKSKKVLCKQRSVICGWNLIKKQISKNQTSIIPVDSEHFSIYKLLENNQYNQIRKIYITASGGPFLNLDLKNLKYKSSSSFKTSKWKMGKNFNRLCNLMNKMLN